MCLRLSGRLQIKLSDLFGFRHSVHPFEQLIQVLCQSGNFGMFSGQMQSVDSEALASHVDYFVILFDLISGSDNVFNSLGYFDVVFAKKLYFRLGAVIVNFA